MNKSVYQQPGLPSSLTVQEAATSSSETSLILRHHQVVYEIK
jgi:hypothetical protein